MCMEDIAIARATKTNTYFIAATNIAIGANANRLSIRLCPSDGQVLELYATNPGLGLNADMNALLGYSSRPPTGALNDRPCITLPCDIRLEDVGNRLLGDLSVVPGPDGGGTVIETYLDLNDPSLAKYNTNNPSSPEVLKKLGIGV